MRPSTASTPLSSSALNYLESFERNAKALRGNNNGSSTSGGNKKDESSTSKSIVSSPAPVKRRVSISDIISQARRQVSLSRTDSEDFDFLNESLKSSVFDESVSSDTDSEESHEEKRILPLGTPGQQVGRKSLKDIRELRNSIDQSLIKPPELKMLRSKAAGEESKRHAHFESIQEEEKISEDLPTAQLPSKSPFKKAIQSGSESSDSDSIIFDEVFEEVLPSPPRKPAPARTAPIVVEKKIEKPAVKEQKARKKKEKTPTPTESSFESSSDSSSTSESSTSSESSSSASESESESKSESQVSSSKTSTSKASSSKAYGSDFESEKSSSSSASTISKVTPKKLDKPQKTKKPDKKRAKPDDIRQNKKPEPIPYEDFIPKLSSRSSNSEKSTVRETNRTLEESLKKTLKINKSSEKMEKPRKDIRRAPRSSSSSSSTLRDAEREQDIERRREKRARRFRSRRRRSEEPHTCQENIHNMIESVIDTHVQMLDDFNRMEYAAVCEWTQVLRKFDGHDGPSSQKLREIIERRLNRKY
ncbi:uncharacterized protein CELE_F59B10.2 [Caenorhabditis elegans]|uniref:Uncharacterized protein F59B10.2 n=1 Tax=Caenorhabditis elegans TaxID=6239 RepID=YSR2_CAEEL|nr:Uncharacterized protein CELE_F59B10.2 [Caenorhabditis elegans]Q09950.3 RecName: Full=Uncharacterized protein F59B10.2 [Caenorhabditis elegans]CAA88601.3 Uncharacterized protein CELE_F59B10.2 [Caenorhabditis elegans]|eukprot:NP_496263.2 Uncharacterized protein CELE_F59B10.2 [Caenorhabditis elegans]